MKRLFSTLLILLLIYCIAPNTSASGYENVISRSEMQLDNNVTVIDEVVENTTSRSSIRDYTRKKTIMNNGTTVAVIAVRGVFSYDGTTVSVISKTVTQSDTYDGWSYKQNSFTSSGGTIALDAKLTKLLVLNIPVTMTLSCDKNGNISYT